MPKCFWSLSTNAELSSKLIEKYNFTWKKCCRINLVMPWKYGIFGYNEKARFSFPGFDQNWLGLLNHVFGLIREWSPLCVREIFGLDQFKLIAFKELSYKILTVFPDDSYILRKSRSNFWVLRQIKRKMITFKLPVGNHYMQKLLWVRFLVVFRFLLKFWCFLIILIIL